MIENNIPQLLDWLMQGPAWVRYHTQVDLIGIADSDKAVQGTRKTMFKDPHICSLIQEIACWETTPLTRHNDASHPLHKLNFLSEVGLTVRDADISKFITRITNHQSNQGPFQILINIPPHFGGSGKDEWLWQLCDAPLVLFCLIKFGLGHDARIQQAIRYLLGLIRENGWPCAASPEMGKFHGPGRREDPCPYANLLMLKLISTQADLINSTAANIGVEAALSLWEKSRMAHPYLFRMGRNFQKLKVPFIWYDILHLVDVLSNYPQAVHDKRFSELLDIIHAKANPLGQYIPESIWTKWGVWEFSQKKEPSRWLTLVVGKINKRVASFT